MRRSAKSASAAALVTVAALTTAACGAGTSGNATRSSGIPSAVQANYDAGIAETGSYQAPETSTRSDPGKHITAVVYGNQSAASPIFSAGLREAAAAAGWKVDIVDGKFSSSVYVSAIQQAIAQKADGIVLDVIDCASVKAAAEQAKKAGIPIVYVEGLDCGPAGSKEATGYELGTARDINGKDVTYTEFLKQAGAIQADAAIVATKGAVNALAVNFAESTATQAQTDGFVEEMKLCPSCTTKVVDMKFADLGSGLQSKVSSALLQNPKINTIFGNYDDPVVNGIIQAVQSSGRKDIYITGEAGYPSMLQAIREGKAQMTDGYDVGIEAWGAVERLNRIFHGDTATFNDGLGLHIITKDHNLPAPGAQYVAPVDYPGIYRKAWSAK